ncbi:MAG: DUF3800 domain-containing protein [Clostridia bacterium]|nr:DUF3800 domain-containing protein [Clostridia bacterium]
MGKKKFVIAIDDTGFNASQKVSKALQKEKVTYAGVIIPKPIVGELVSVLTQLGEELKKRHGVDEFHFKAIYNREKEFKNIQIDETLEILESFAELFNIFKLKVVSTTCNEYNQNLVLSKLMEPVLKNMHIKFDEKSMTMFTTCLRAKKYVTEQKRGAIDKIICDEGLRKEGTVISIGNEGLQLSFESSEKQKLLQLADFAAWMITRAKHILDKMQSKHQISDIDKYVMAIYGKMKDVYLNMKKARINYTNLESFSYDDIIENKDRRL